MKKFIKEAYFIQNNNYEAEIDGHSKGKFTATVCSEDAANHFNMDVQYIEKYNSSFSGYIDIAKDKNYTFIKKIILLSCDEKTHSSKLIKTETIDYNSLLNCHDSGFKEIASPENYGLTWDDAVDVTEINGVLAVICEQDGKLSVHPAFGGSGFAMDSYCHDLGIYGDWGDYTKIDCPSCNHSWYFNQRRIPDSEMYECICPKCGMLLKRKKV